MAGSRFLIGVTAHFGYPQPENGFIAASFDATDYCCRCGIGGLQNAPFRFRSEPKTRHSQFLQLNWIFDEFFVRPAVREALEGAGITGTSFGPAVHHRTGAKLGSIEQLRITTVLAPALDTTELQRVTCKRDNEEPPTPEAQQAALRYSPAYPYCGRVKYHWPEALCFRSSAFDSAPDVVKSYEWFGSGGGAARAVLVSERFEALLREQRWRGLYVKRVMLL
jgi:hypothetical protein